MYIPRQFAAKEHQHLLDVMREYAFATVFATVEGEPFVTHAPVRIDASGEGLRIEGHVATANPHARALNGARTLVVFSGPHTYISPTLYASDGRVPTWNHIAVHATGEARTIDAIDAKHRLLTRLIDEHEPDFNPRFERFDERHRHALLNAITGFEIVVGRLEGKFKLGQHRLADDLPTMRSSHEEGDGHRRALAGWMKRLGYWV